jgi:hypothetical protein
MIKINGQIIKTPESEYGEDVAALAALQREVMRLRRAIASIRAAMKQRHIGRKRNARIKHLVATRGGAEWVIERLPTDDYANFDPKVPTVDKLLSKPIGYRLSKGFNVIRHGNLDRI